MQCAVCGTLIHVVCAVYAAVCGSSACGSVRLSGSAAVCGSVCGSARLFGSDARKSVRQCGSGQLSGSAAVCSSVAVCIISNKFV
jgi:hypothetical protein